MRSDFFSISSLQQAFAALPTSITERRLRADSALYNEAALTWADEQGVKFAVSADMSEALAKAVERLPESAWSPYRTLRATERADPQGEERQWADVEFIAQWSRNHKKHGETFRYIAIRVRSRQRDLFSDDAARWRHFAVVTNLLELLKVETLPAELRSLRPKALRFRLFNVAGRLLYSGRQLVLRLSAALPSASLYAKAREILRAALPRPAPA